MTITNNSDSDSGFQLNSNIFKILYLRTLVLGGHFRISVMQFRRFYKTACFSSLPKTFSIFFLRSSRLRRPSLSIKRMPSK